MVVLADNPSIKHNPYSNDEFVGQEKQVLLQRQIDRNGNFISGVDIKHNEISSFYRDIALLGIHFDDEFPHAVVSKDTPAVVDD